MTNQTLNVLFLLITLILPFSAHATQNAALNQLTGSGMEEGEAIALTNALRGELTRTGKFDMLERSQINEILHEQGFQLSGACTTEECIVEIGQLLAVRYMFMGHVGKVGGTYSVSIRQIDVQSGRVMRDITENYRGVIDDVLTKVIPSVARQIAGIEENVRIRKKRWPWIAGGVLAAGAVPVALFLSKDNSGEETIVDVEVEW